MPYKTDASMMILLFIMAMMRIAPTIAHKGDDGQIQALTAAQIIVALPIGSGLRDALIQVLELLFEAAHPKNDTEHTHRSYQQHTDHRNGNKGLVIDKRLILYLCIQKYIKQNISPL